METYLSIKCPTMADARANQAAIRKAYPKIDNACIAGNEILIPVPFSGLNCSLNRLRSLLSDTAQADLFDVTTDASGKEHRWWYCL